MTSKKILLVDDDMMSVEFMKIYLESEGYGISCAHSFQEAISLISSEQFAILVTDIQLSDGMGTDLAKAFRHSAKQPIKIIGVTGYSKESLDNFGNETALFDSVLTKPLDLERLSKHLTES